VPAGRPLTAWLPLVAALLRPFPLTTTEVALLLDQVIVVDPGADVVAGLALIEADTANGAATVTV
jgi:hypothetical protein